MTGESSTKGKSKNRRVGLAYIESSSVYKTLLFFQNPKEETLREGDLMSGKFRDCGTFEFEDGTEGSSHSDAFRMRRLKRSRR